jgi:hypothetical protein
LSQSFSIGIGNNLGKGTQKNGLLAGFTNEDLSHVQVQKLVEQVGTTNIQDSNSSAIGSNQGSGQLKYGYFPT